VRKLIEQLEAEGGIDGLVLDLPRTAAGT